MRSIDYYVLYVWNHTDDDDDAAMPCNCSEPNAEWDEEVEDGTRDGSNHIHDKEAGNQHMSREDIEGLKASGAEGARIVDALVTNSKTFDKMSGFAQKKYKCVECMIRQPVLRRYICIMVWCAGRKRWTSMC